MRSFVPVAVALGCTVLVNDALNVEVAVAVRRCVLLAVGTPDLDFVALRDIKRDIVVLTDAVVLRLIVIDAEGVALEDTVAVVDADRVGVGSGENDRDMVGVGRKDDVSVTVVVVVIEDVSVAVPVKLLDADRLAVASCDGVHVMVLVGAFIRVMDTVREALLTLTDREGLVTV